MNKMTVHDINVKGKHVLMRVDFNVPMDKRIVTDDKPDGRFRSKETCR